MARCGVGADLPLRLPREERQHGGLVRGDFTATHAERVVGIVVQGRLNLAVVDVQKARLNGVVKPGDGNRYDQRPPGEQEEVWDALGIEQVVVRDEASSDGVGRRVRREA